MFSLRASQLFFVAIAASGLVLAQGECVGSAPLATFRLMASPPTGSPVWMSVRQLNNLPAGYKVRYQPGSLPPDVGKDAAFALLLIPKTGDGQVTVLEPGPATSTSNWTVPFDSSVVLLVFAPQGFDQKRLTNLMSRDPALVSALVDYADQTNNLEATLSDLSHMDADEDALQQAKPTTPAEEALLALVRNLNPAVSSFDPFGSGRRAGSVTMMGKGATLFFENAGGVVPGGGILPVAKQFLLPDAEFRSVYAVGVDGAMTLCAQRQARTRNRVAYVWAYGLTNQVAPRVAIAGNSDNIVDAPIGMRFMVPLKFDVGGDWDLLARITDWGLVPRSGGAPIHVDSHFMTSTRELRLDLRGFAGLPDLYRLEGRWDWGTVRVDGGVRLHALGDLNKADVTPESRDRLVTDTGPVSLDLAGANLRFIKKAWMHHAQNERPIAVDLPAKFDGPADKLRVEADTDGLHPGPYFLALTRVDGTSAEIPVQVLPAPPKIDSTNLRLNLGEPAGQSVVLMGAGLQRLEGVESTEAILELKDANPEGTRREAIVRLHANVAVGQSITLAAKVMGMTGLLHFPGVFQVAAPRPRIMEAKSVAPADMGVTLKDGEIAVGTLASFQMRVESAGDQPTLTVSCARSDSGVKVPYTVSAPGMIFASFDPAVVSSGAGCRLMASLASPDLGSSDGFALGTLVRVPRIEKFTMTNDVVQGGFVAIVEGWDLETIERTGWNAGMGLVTQELPRPIAGQGSKQTLRIAMPWPSPSPKAPLFVWLRGETEARATRATP